MPPLCDDARVEVRIDEQTIPTVEEGVTVTVSTDAQNMGSDITKYAECQIPLEWRSSDIMSKVKDFDPETQSSYSLASIFFQDVRNEGYYPVIRGFVRGVRGSSDKMGVGTVHISSPDTLATAVPFSGRYDRPTVGEVFSDAIETFNDNTPFNAQLRGVSGRTVSTTDFVEDALGVASFGLTDAVGKVLPDVTAFKSNRHSVSDALNWVCENTNGKWYFSFRHQGTSGLSLVYDDGSNSVAFTQRENKSGAQDRRLNNQGSFPDLGATEVDVIDNDALQELFPVNTVRIMGSTGVSLFGFETHMVPAKRFPFVEVQYTPLVRRAGGQSVAVQLETDNVTVESALERGKSELRKRIVDSGTGSMTVYGKPQIIPYDTITAKPTCADVVPNADMRPLTHQVASVTHQKSAHSEYLTTINVSPEFDPSKVETVVSEMRDV